MDLWTLFALLLLAALVASTLPAPTPPPQVIVVQTAEPAYAGSGCLPLLLLLAAVLGALILL